MKGKGKYIILFMLTVFGLLSCSKKALPKLYETYSYRDKNPFGASVAFDILKNAYPLNNVEIIKKNFSDNYQWDYDTSSLYMNISKNFYIDNRDAESLLDFVYKGNTVFIASENIDTNLLSKLHAGTKKDLSVLFDGNDPLRYTATGYKKELSLYKDSFNYFYVPFNNYFSETKGMHARTVGENIDGNPNLCAFFWGKGRIFLHCEPRALSNYFLLTDNNSLYMQEILQLMPAEPENIYWDDLHNMQNDRSSSNVSTLDMILKSPGLAHAFFILLALLLLYIFFNSKRRQRIIPVIKPVENNSIAFAEAIAGLYLGKKDNKLIAEKMITYFNEHLRTKYFMQLNVNDAGYADMLSRKSGVSTDITIPLAAAIRGIAASPKVSDQQLLLLNGLTEKFFKNKI